LLIWVTGKKAVRGLNLKINFGHQKNDQGGGTTEERRPMKKKERGSGKLQRGRDEIYQTEHGKRKWPASTSYRIEKKAWSDAAEKPKKKRESTNVKKKQGKRIKGLIQYD